MRAGVLLLLLVVACGTQGRSSGLSGQEEPPPGGFGSSGSFDVDGSAPGGDGCSDAARLVYLVTAEDDLYSFAPDKLTFTKVGRLACPRTGLATPNSMSVDRSGTAWVNYSDGSLFKVSTADATCAATSFVKGQNENFLRFGMAFATTGSKTTEERLYISGLHELAGTGYGLGTIDLTTFELKMVGDYSGALRGKGAELTGTGDGRLFGFFTTTPATLAEIDKTTGSTSNERVLDGVTTGNAWAFCFWGGDFWFFTSTGLFPSTLTRLATSEDGKLSVVKQDVGGFRVVGAGVSTCAPTAPPR
jgi:hypothetical protein